MTDRHSCVSDRTSLVTLPPTPTGMSQASSNPIPVPSARLTSQMSRCPLFHLNPSRNVTSTNNTATTRSHGWRDHLRSSLDHYNALRVLHTPTPPVVRELTPPVLQPIILDSPWSSLSSISTAVMTTTNEHTRQTLTPVIAPHSSCTHRQSF
jgi:hypothetical protein